MSVLTGSFNWRIVNEAILLHFGNLITYKTCFRVDAGNFTAIIRYIYRNCMWITFDNVSWFDTNTVNRMLNRLKVNDDGNIGGICEPLVFYVILPATIFKKSLLIMVLLIMSVSSTDCRFIVCDAKVDQIINKCFDWFSSLDGWLFDCKDKWLMLLLWFFVRWNSLRLFRSYFDRLNE